MISLSFHFNFNSTLIQKYMKLKIGIVLQSDRSTGVCAKILFNYKRKTFIAHCIILVLLQAIIVTVLKQQKCYCYAVYYKQIKGNSGLFMKQMQKCALIVGYCCTLLCKCKVIFKCQLLVKLFLICGLHSTQFDWRVRNIILNFSNYTWCKIQKQLLCIKLV